MDKNKSRSDLLAAGRKKLQQYRKKKDNKGSGSQGNSSKNTSKLEQHDAEEDIVTAAAKSTSGSNSTDGVLASSVDCKPDTGDVSASPSTEHSLAAEIAHAAVSVKQEMDLAETSATDQGKVPMQEVGNREDCDHPIKNAEASGIISSESSLPNDAEENKDRTSNLSSTEFSSQISSASVEQQGKIVEVWGRCREEELLPSPSTSLLQAREDVGMEDALMQSGQVHETKLPEDKQVETGGMSESAAETTFKDTSCDEEEVIAADVASVSVVVTESNSSSISSPSEKLDMKNSSSSSRDDWKEGSQVHAEDMIHSSRSQVQYIPGDNFLDQSEGHERVSQTSVKISDAGDANTISRNAHMTGTSDAQPGTFSSFGHDCEILNLLERMKEELIVTSFSNDIFNMQISEQNELQMELDNHRYKSTNDMLHTSLNEVVERNQSLVDELSNCRSELEHVSIAKEELRVQLLTAEAAIEKLSSRTSETENSLEKFHGDMFRLAKELDDCKHLVTVLEGENERLNGIITFENENKRKLVEEKELYNDEKEKILSELSSLKSLKVTLEVENSKLMGSLSSVAEEKAKLEEEREQLFQVNGTLSVELANCKNLVATQQEEIMNLTKNLALVTEDRTMVEEDKNRLFHENEKMASELLVLDERLSTEHEERVKFEGDLKDTLMQLDQLTEENVFLSNSLDIHKFKIEELCGEIVSLQRRSTEIEDQSENMDSDMYHGNKSQGNDSSQITFKKCLPETSSVLTGGKLFMATEQESFDDYLGFVALGRRLEEADLMLQKLEKEITRLQSDSASSRSDGKIAAPAVSKLIQAFESKVNVEEHEVEAEIQLPDDPYKLSTELVDNLRVLLRQVVMDSENASVLLKGERDHRKVAMSTFNEFKDQFEGLENHSNNLVIANIEHVVLFECLKHHVNDAGARIYELEILNESLKQQCTHHKNFNRELAERLCGYELKITDLECQLSDLHQSSNEMVSSICHQLDNLQEGAIDRAMIIEKDWNSFVLELAETIAKFDESLGKSDTSAIKFCTSDQLPSYIAASVIDAVKMVDDLREKLQATASNGEAFRMLYEEVNEKYDNLFRKTESSVDMLHKIYGELQKLYIAYCGSVSGSDMNMQVKILGDPLDYSHFESLIKPLEDCITERVQLESVNNKLHLDLERRTEEFVEYRERCLDSIGIEKLIKDVQSVLLLEDTEKEQAEIPAFHLESMISLLLQKYRESELQLGLSREESESLMMKLTELQESVHDLSTLNLDHECEIVLLKESLSQAQEALVASRSELKDTVKELEQAEQRVSAIREKLSIAVAKGKSLIVQRDNLKQSLAQTSSELERYLLELQMKDTRLHETETKLKTYSEAGERVEALESELSYIRNSATALRESFLLKDSVLQRIEEILDELDLPENFHSRDIIEKIDWLAKSSTGENLHTDWDQRSSVAGGSGSDANFVITDAWKDEAQPDGNVGDDLRRKYEELQTKFYGLAEQNEMLEQSLMERNIIVQRWEELLEKIDIPSHLRSMEPEDKIEWLHGSLSEACHDRDSLHQRVNYLENYCGSLTADLDDSQKKISDIEAELQSVLLEREELFEKLEIIHHHNDHLSFGTFENEIENIVLQNELSNAQEKLITTEHTIVKLEAILGNALQDEDMNALVPGNSSVEFLELMVMKLVQNYAALSLGNSVPGSAMTGPDTEEMLARSIDEHVACQNDINVLKKDLEDAMHQLMVVTKERDQYMEMHESLIVKVESLDKKKDELQELLDLEEQKSASVREKLNVAVRKGKSLVQQRDSLKQIIEEMTTELKQLRSEMKSQENTIASYEQKCRDFSVYSGRVEALESENLSLKNRLKETESNLQEKEYKLSSIINTLVHVDLNVDVNETDPIEKLKQVGKLCSDLREAMAFSQQESAKSRRAAELLLAELNEVQERNDAFQEEIAKASDEISDLTKERDLAETSKLEALSELEKLTTLHLTERKNQISQFMGLKSGVDRLKEALHEVNSLLADAFSRDLDAFYNLEAAIESCTKANGPAEVKPSPSTVSGASKKDKGSFFALDSWLNSYANASVDETVATEIHSQFVHQLEESMEDIGALKEMIDGHSVSFNKQSDSLSKVLGELYQEVNSQKELVQALELDLQQSESVAKDKEKEGDVLCRNIAVLYEACTATIKEVDQRKRELMGNDLTGEYLGVDIISTTPDHLSRTGKTHLLSEEYVQAIADGLLLAVREFLGLKAEMFDGGVKDMKVTIANLQKELQEKDIQKERICMELVAQIKEAEGTATRYSLDLQASKEEVHELEKVMEQMESERKALEQRLREMQDGLSISDELRDRVKSLTDSLAAKDQEIEALMHALDEEEVQMEGLTNKIEELETVLKQKNQELESTENSRGKLTKKLSITVTKFDELHHLSESLLTEVEQLQTQLQDRDAEISFLRQEVARCTNDALVATQSSNRSTEDINEVITWFDTMEARVGLSHTGHDDQEKEVHGCKEVLKKKITSIVKEIEDLQAVSRRKDELLLVEKNKVEELKRKELQLNLLGDVGDHRAINATPEIFESEPLINKWAASSTSITPQVRSLRKGNTDQVAIAIDMDPASSSNRLEDEDDDKVHGFKSLASSRLVPRFSRRATDMIDGLWVSCDRALMRQPALRLGIIFYWAILHALLATFVV